MQEIGILALRSDPSDSLMRTIALTTELEVTPEVEAPQEKENPDESRVLVM